MIEVRYYSPITNELYAVKRYKSLKGAIRASDRLDLKYGAYLYKEAINLETGNRVSV